MAELKFVTFLGYSGKEQIVVFPAKAQHKQFADSFTKLTFGEFHPVAGGFVEEGECVGESISLRMKARPEDTILLQELIN